MIAQSDGPRYTQTSGRDFIMGSDGPSYVARSDSPSLILATPRTNGPHHATSAATWKGFNGLNSATSSNKAHCMGSWQINKSEISPSQHMLRSINPSIMTDFSKL